MWGITKNTAYCTISKERVENMDKSLMTISWCHFTKGRIGLPWWHSDKNPPAAAGDTGLFSGPGGSQRGAATQPGSHSRWARARVLPIPKPMCPEPAHHTAEARTSRSPCVPSLHTTRPRPAHPEALESRACTSHGWGPHIPKPLHPEPAHHTAEAHRLQPEPTGCSDWSPGTSTCSATKQLQWEAYKLQRRASLHSLQLEKAHVKQLRPSTAIKGGRITQKGKKYLKHSLRYNFHE